MSNTSRYSVSQSVDGFQITNSRHPLDVPGAPEWLVEIAYDYSGIRRTPVIVMRNPHCIELIWNGQQRFHTFPDFYRILNTTANGLMAKWEPPDRSDEESAPILYPEHQAKKFLKPWAVKRTAWAINKLVHSEWKRLVLGADQRVLALQRRVFSVGFGYEEPGVLFDPSLYFHKHIISDIQRYRAAATAAVLSGRYRHPLLVMENWKSLFSPTEDSYRSLNRTLMNLPGGVPPKLLLRLNRFELERPITNRIELITAILGNGTRERRNGRIYMLAREDAIRSAMARISRFLHRDLSWRRWRDVNDAIMFMNDFPDEHSGNIVGLAEKSIRWHRDDLRRQTERTVAKLGADCQVKRPPIPLPDDIRIRFLATIGDLCEEGAKMEHCVSSYAELAISGISYLFHVEYVGESATVEVVNCGQVRQSLGPRNQTNAATAWGRKVLGVWARQLKRHRRLSKSDDGV